jgi:hypothetical protein
MPTPTADLIRCTLQTGVPFRMLDIQQRGGPTDTDWGWARSFAQALGEKGDILLYRSHKKGETGHIMEQFINAVALLAFCPGGITIYGLHFDAGTPDSTGAMCCVTWPLNLEVRV